ncbi:Protein LIKE COV 3 [Camellia lanceoleosa]|uniref:Protein LIKE COV 3 n=1 Tax=Camellia lanceoleosa TaxID=1840588 RepID=A0ACC0GJG0_9ERIC|nr:Protein LIKE COV 3 [Camellia lanceoleosa]
MGTRENDKDLERLIPVGGHGILENGGSKSSSPSSASPLPSSSHHSGKEAFYKVFRSWASIKFMSGWCCGASRGLLLLSLLAIVIVSASLSRLLIRCTSCLVPTSSITTRCCLRRITRVLWLRHVVLWGRTRICSRLHVTITRLLLHWRTRRSPASRWTCLVTLLRISSTH